jgi:cellulose synthase/poly-beta-1,6-N-acetylglucosamine synthase-like glycosyltransferase
MTDVVLVPLAVVYFVVVGLLFLYNVNFLLLTWASLTRRAPPPEPEPPAEWPPVTVQLPIYNELYVAERAVRAAAQLDYPRDRLEIQVLDDSTDETAAIVAKLVARLRSSGLDIQQIRRKSREGFKAGALKVGLARAKGEYIAIFDADAVPPRDSLRRIIPHFAQPRIAFVQARWTHLDRDYSILTQLQSMAIDAHFRVEQYARHAMGLWFHFNGSGGVWRREAIEDAGGWSTETLCEDLDLSYRAFLAGWQARYLDNVEMPAEVPASLAAYRRQQHRWARGSLECAGKTLPLVWRSKAPLLIKLSASLQMTGYAAHLLMAGLALLYPALLWLSPAYPALSSLFGLGYLFGASALGPMVFIYAGQSREGRAGLRAVPRLLLLSAMGAGMMVNTVRAALDILRHRNRVFERTPKYGLEHKGQGWESRRYQLGLDWIVVGELLLFTLNSVSALWALAIGNFFIAFYAGLFACGLLMVAAMSLHQALRLAERQLAARRSPADAA